MLSSKMFVPEKKGFGSIDTDENENHSNGP